MKYITLFVFSFLTLNGLAQPRQKSEQITVDGITRNFVTYIPSGTNTAEKLPVVISLHGRFGNGKGMMSFADFRPLAEKEKFIIVCPDGINRSWNGGGPTPAERKGINDVKFIDQLITYILNTYNGDAKRVYVTGMSNGGFMSSRLACELNSRIAAIAVVGASMAKGMSYQPGKPIPVMYIHGTKDPLVPFAGGVMKKGTNYDIYGHEEIVKLWAVTDHCDETPSVTNLPDNANDGTSIIKEEYTNNATGVKVIGYTITNGGHTWPGGAQYLPKFLIGDVSHNLNACEVIWDFFKGCRLVD
jgi:polyhydroxybutyrate depolymerase